MDGRVCHDYYKIIYMIRVFTSAHATADKFTWTRLEHEAIVPAGEHRRTEGRQKRLYYLINHFIDLAVYCLLFIVRG